MTSNAKCRTISNRNLIAWRNHFFCDHESSMARDASIVLLASGSTVRAAGKGMTRIVVCSVSVSPNVRCASCRVPLQKLRLRHCIRMCIVCDDRIPGQDDGNDSVS